METLEKQKVKTVKLRLIVLDESKHWKDDIQKACGKIKTVYMYDANQHTYCCEIFPSYSLIPLYSFAENEISDEMEEQLMQGDTENSEPRYFHVRFIDTLETKKAVFSHHLDGGLRYYASEGKKYNDIIESAREYFSGNRPY